jgi:hypothetical protein
MTEHMFVRGALFGLIALCSLGMAYAQGPSLSASMEGSSATGDGVPESSQFSPLFRESGLLAQAPAPPAGFQRPPLSIQKQVAPTAVPATPQMAPSVQLKPSIVIRSPGTNTKWETGDRVTISWQTLNLPAQDFLSVELMNYTGTSRVEYLGNSNTGSLEWTIPTSIYKWPGNHRIRVATLDNKVEKISDMFHIGLKTAQKTVTIKADTVNKVKSRDRSGSAFSFVQLPPTADPGPHRMRVGFERRRVDSVDYSWIYRSHVKANVYAHRNEGFLIKATLHYPRLAGDEIDERFCVLTAPWNGQPETLFTVPCDIERIGPNRHDVTAHVRKWLTYPDSNYGFLFFGRDESLGFDTQYRGAATYGDVTLVLEFESAQ